MKELDNFSEEVDAISPDQQTESFPPLKLMFIAGWFGLITGLLEAFFLIGWRHFVKESPITVSLHALWMAPVAEMIIFILLACVPAFLYWQFPRLFTLRIVYFFFALFFFVALFLLFPQLNIYAKLILAIGLAVQTARLIVKHQKGFYQLVRRSSFWLAAIVAVLALGTFAWQALTERNALAKLPPPATNSMPNVILITLDTVRAKNLSLYGYERQTTPQLEKLAKDGVVFEQAIATAPWTLPSHGSIFTGQYPHEFSFGWTESFKTSHETLAEELGRQGYESAGFAANLIYCTRAIGIARGMTHYEDYPVSLGQTILSASLGRAISNSGFVRQLTGFRDTLNRKQAEEINDDFLSWLSSRHQDRPFFAFLNYFDAHEPILPPAPFNEQFGSANTDEKLQYHGVDIEFINKHDWSEQEAQKYRNAYDNSIAYLDHQLGELFAKLSEKGLLDNTLVIITADHGELLGEHGIYGHGSSLYIETLRVPLLIRFPSRIPKGMRIQKPVSLRDLPATVLDFLGEENQTQFAGESLRKTWDKEAGEENSTEQKVIFSELSSDSSFAESWYPASKGGMQSLITEQYHYIRNDDGSEEFFDRKNDPNELQNLAQTQEAQKLLEEFRSALKNKIS